jgi:catechol 1,2-dioxygenase
MRGFMEETATEVVLARLSECSNARIKEVMTSIIHHLHAVTREVEPTQEEWMAAIHFLTATGQLCDIKRQEWILLSDTLGVSMLVDTINNRKPAGATQSTVLGPFHLDSAPQLPAGSNISRDGKGDPLVVSGRVLDPDRGPIEGAELDVWQANPEGFYDVQQPGVQPAMNLRGRFRTDADGRFHFRSIKPCFYPIPTDGPVGRLLSALGRHPYRPAHIHFIISADGFQPVTTHLFVEGDPYLESDAVFGVKESLIVPFVLETSAERAAALGVTAPFYTVEYDFRLAAAS